MLLDLARSRKVIFFGGKGGVGKTTVSAATALAMANEGKRVLLVSTDPAHNLGHLFDRKIGPKPVKLWAGLDGLELDPEKTVELHLEEVTSALRRLMPVHLRSEIDKHMELSRNAPGMQEAAMLERIAEVVEQGAGQDSEYDLIIFDTAPSGHTARLMVLPEMMSAWTDGLIKRRDKADKYAKFVKELGKDSSMEDKVFGENDEQSEEMKESRIRQILNRRRVRFAGLRNIISNHDFSSFVIVLAAERLPVLETIELHHQLHHTGVEVGALVVNKRVPQEQGDFFAGRRQQEEKHLGTLNGKLGKIPRLDLELVAEDVVGLDALREFSLRL